MSTSDILQEINQLSLNDRLLIIEQAVREILRQNNELQMSVAAEALGNEYKTNRELTAFTNLDLEDFYETK
jgi:hypothetical protein